MEKYRLSELNEKLYEAVKRITYEALGEVATKYGSGYEDGDRPTKRDMAYHNLQHSWHVKSVAERLAGQYGLNAFDARLAAMIAAAHDVEHEPTADASAELRSAEWLVWRMHVAGFNDEDKEIACLAIEGTTPLLGTDGAFAGQRYSSMRFPNERAETIARCVAAADMSAAYSAHGPKAAHDLFKERAGLGAHERPATLEGLEEFQSGQITFLERLEPVYPGVDQLLGGLKEQGMRYHTFLLQELRASRITSWAEIERLDAEYAAGWSTER